MKKSDKPPNRNSNFFDLDSQGSWRNRKIEVIISNEKNALIYDAKEPLDIELHSGGYWRKIGIHLHLDSINYDMIRKMTTNFAKNGMSFEQIIERLQKMLINSKFSNDHL